MKKILLIALQYHYCCFCSSKECWASHKSWENSLGGVLQNCLFEIKNYDDVHTRYKDKFLLGYVKINNKLGKTFL
jgi:hypothetical protein